MAKTIKAKKPFAVISTGVHAEDFKGFIAINNFDPLTSTIQVNADIEQHHIQWYGTKEQAQFHPALASAERKRERQLVRENVRASRTAKAYAGKEFDVYRYMVAYTEEESPDTVDRYGYPYLWMECEATGLKPYEVCKKIIAKIAAEHENELARIKLRESIK